MMDLPYDDRGCFKDHHNTWFALFGPQSVFAKSEGLRVERRNILERVFKAKPRLAHMLVHLQQPSLQLKPVDEADEYCKSIFDRYVYKIPSE